MRSFLKIATWLLLGGLVNQPLAAADRPLTVVELYTSQGCSSCPPADAYLGKLAARDDVLALSLHVDYWDYIGWKDPYANPEHTIRQRTFAVKFSQRYVYTPQMVVQGAFQIVGSHVQDIEEAIAKAKSLEYVPLKLTDNQGTFSVEIPQQRGQQDKGEDIRVFAVFFDKLHQTEIKRGENAGQQLANYNVVRSFEEIGTWNGGAQTIIFINKKALGDSSAVILQSYLSGKILGAARL